MRKISVFVLLAIVLALVGCSSKPAATDSNANQLQGPGAPAGTPASATAEATPPAATPAAEPPKPVPIILPAGTAITVRLGQQIGSKISQSGQPFQASLANPISHKEKVVIPAGAEITGTVLDAKPAGKFKGGAVLAVELNSVVVGGKTIRISTSDVQEQSKGKGKRTATMIGGGAGVGALIGGLAGGGKGAAIGAAVGAGAGTAGAAFTGDRDIVLPAETALTFKLKDPVQVGTEIPQ